MMYTPCDECELAGCDPDSCECECHWIRTDDAPLEGTEEESEDGLLDTEE